MVEQFCKSRTQVAGATDAKDLFVARFNELAEVAAGKAIAAAKAENATSSLVRAAHLEKAFEGLRYSTDMIDGQGIIRHGFNSQLRRQRHVEEALRLVRSLQGSASAPPGEASDRQGAGSRS